MNTRKYPLRGYILGVLTHTTALDQLWGGDKTMNIYLGFASERVFLLGIRNSDHVFLGLNTRTSASLWRQRSHWGLRVTQDVHFSLLTHTKQVLLLTFCDTAAETEVSVRIHGNRTETDGQTNVEVEIVI